MTDRKLPNGNTAPPDPLAFPQVANQFTTTTSAGVRNIAGLTVGKITCTALTVSGNVDISGVIVSPIIAVGGLSIPRGALNAPSINVIGDPFVGIYSPAAGQIALCANGNPAAVASSSGLQISGQITTASGNLILNPAGGAVDFSGKAIINFSGFATNPNYYDITAPANVDTVGATTAQILVISTVPNSVYTLEAYASCLSVTDGTNSASFIQSCKAKNISGVLTISTEMEVNRSRDPPIATTCALSFVASGTNVILTATGVVGNTLRWWGAVKVQKITL
jgi:hypothetical protein